MEGMETTMQPEGGEEMSRWDAFFTEDAPEDEAEERLTEEEEEEGEAGEDGGSEPEEEVGRQQEGFSEEQQAAIDAATRQRIDAFYRQQYAGYLNPYTGRPIESEADFLDYQQAFEAEEQERRLGEMGIDPTMLNEMVGNLPVVQEAQRVLLQQQQAQADSFVKEQFDAFLQEYPDCGFANAGEMMQDAKGRAVLEFWRDSPRLSIADAYMILNKETLRSQQTAAVKQGVLNQMNGTKHLKQTKGSSVGGAEMPEADRDALKRWFPKATDAEIKEMWLKNQKYSEA